MKQNNALMSQLFEESDKSCCRERKRKMGVLQFFLFHMKLSQKPNRKLENKDFQEHISGSTKHEQGKMMMGKTYLVNFYFFFHSNLLYQ